MKTSEFVLSCGRIRGEARHVDDGELGRVLAELRRIGLGNEQVPREQAVPRLLGDDADRQPVRRVGARPAVLDEELLAPQVGQHAPLEPVERRGVDRPIDLAPRDVLLARGFLDDELVVGGSTGVLARRAHQRALGRDHAFAAPDDFLVQ